MQVALFAALELDARAVEVDQQRAFFVLAEHHAEVAVEDVLVVVIAGLDDLVARLDAPRAGIGAAQAALQGLVEGLDAAGAFVHRRQHLDVAQRVEAERLREDIAAELRDHRHAGLGVVDAHEVDVLGEVQFRRILDRRGRGGVGVQDAVGDRDDAAPGALTEDRVETRDRGRAGIDEVTEHIAGAD